MPVATPDQVVFFFGAGASAPFGIPTMKQMVIAFEEELSEKGTEEEIEVYGDIKKTLEAVLGAKTDLEGVFTVIDGIINYDVERLGLLSIYQSTVSFGELLTKVPPTDEVKRYCKSLRTKFQEFVREKCLIASNSYNIIREVYRDFFNRLLVEFGGSYRQNRDYGYPTPVTWAMFTTNYDLCLEYYWREVVRVPLNTGFTYERARNTMVSNPLLFYDVHRSSEEICLLKLHGSIDWRVERDGTVIEETTSGKSLVGREFVGELMIYPIQQKELYTEPYISMFVQLNRELKKRPVWIIIGYSFNDPVIREVFIRNSDETKKIILVHPHAKSVKEEKLANIRCKEMFLLHEKFGEGDFKLVNYSIIRQLKPQPSHKPNETV